MSRRLIRLVVALIVAGIVWAVRAGPRVAPDQAGRAAPAPVPAEVPRAPAAAPVAHPEVGFRDPSHLAEHFQKHGGEFGAVSQAAYLRLAQELRDRPAGGEVLEAVRADGVITRFDRGSGAFLAFDRDLTIRTFFRPNDGERYYIRQLTRGRSER